MSTFTIPIRICGDVNAEANENFFVNLSNASGAQLFLAQGFGTIIDDDNPPVMSISSTSITEGNGAQVGAVFTVSLSTASGRAVTATYSTNDVTASGANDYFACVSCHIRVPHGGKVGRLILTPTAPARYKVAGAGTTVAFTTRLR